jgi:hypothetical protein
MAVKARWHGKMGASFSEIEVELVNEARNKAGRTLEHMSVPDSTHLKAPQRRDALHRSKGHKVQAEPRRLDLINVVAVVTAGMLIVRSLGVRA